MPAFRNIRLCGKDCLCLYVCPTGATDTENSIIDVSKCTECMNCVRSCPSGAISMLPRKYPPQQPKKAEVIDAVRAVSKSKVVQEQIAEGIMASERSAEAKQFALALSRSNRIMAEDLLREAGYMLPQSNEVHDFLTTLKKYESEGFPMDAVELLQQQLQKSSEEKRK